MTISCSRGMMFLQQQDFDSHVFPDFVFLLYLLRKERNGFSIGITCGTPVHNTLFAMLRYVHLLRNNLFEVCRICYLVGGTSGVITYAYIMLGRSTQFSLLTSPAELFCSFRFVYGKLWQISLRKFATSQQLMDVQKKNGRCSPDSLYS